MKLSVKYFGVIAETIGKDSEEIFLEENKSLNEFTELIESMYPQLQGSVFSFSVNQEIQNDNIELQENDEIALLPPFSGG